MAVLITLSLMWSGELREEADDQHSSSSEALRGLSVSANQRLVLPSTDQSEAAITEIVSNERPALTSRESEGDLIGLECNVDMWAG